jgi:uncharacterized protein (TIGR02246 family)
MSVRILGVLFGGLLALAAAFPSIAGPKEDAYSAVERWAVAFNSGDVEKTVACYTPDALVLGTASPSLASKPDDLRAYFGAASAAKFQVKLGESSAIVLSSDTVAFTGFYDFSRPRDGEQVVIPARFTFLVVKRNGDWKIVHHHSSLRPKPAQ